MWIGAVFATALTFEAFRLPTGEVDGCIEVAVDDQTAMRAPVAPVRESESVLHFSAARARFGTRKVSVGHSHLNIVPLCFVTNLEEQFTHCGITNGSR